MPPPPWTEHSPFHGQFDSSTYPEGHTVHAGIPCRNGEKM